MTQQLVLRPLGIISQPNKLGTIPQGALQLADQCYMRQPGTIENANGYVQAGDSILANASGTSFVAPSDGQYVYFNEISGGSRFSGWVDVTNNASYPFGFDNFRDESGGAQSIDSTGRFGTTVNRSRLLVTAVNGTFVYDLPTHSLTRSAGMPQPQLFFAGSATGVAVPGTSHVMYTGLYIRRFSDGYELIGIPAMAIEWTNGGTSGNSVQVQFALSSLALDGYIKAGDVFQLYRTKSQTYNTATSTYTNTGSDYYLVTEYTMTSTDITNGGATVTDNVPDAALGEALYTNAGVKTQDGLALPSPTAKAICSFKGYTFFFNRKDTPKVSLRAPVWWGYMDTATAGVDASTRQYGIGARALTGNTTNGSPTLASVSAANLVGIVPGQVNRSVGNIPFGAKVISVGASSITFDHNATATTTGAFIQIDDVLEVNGTTLDVGESANLANLVNTTPYFAAVALNYIIPSLGTTTAPPDSVPAAPIDLFYLRLSDQTGNITIRATNGKNYTPQLPEISATVQTFTPTQVPNGLSWSEQNQPENVPPLNTAFCGNGEIYAAYPTRDCIWIFCSDGLYRLSGTGGSAGAEGFDWRIDPVDSTLIIAGPQAGCVLRDMVFAYTNRGLVQINSDGTIKELTLGRVDDRLPGQPWSTPSWSTTNAMFLVADETNDEIWMKETLTPGNRVWIYNYINDCFTNDFIGTDTTTTGNSILSGCYSRYLQSTTWLSQTQGFLVAPTNGTARKLFDFKFQPLLGTDPFSTRMWQQAEIACSFPANGNVTVNCYANGDIRAPLTYNQGQFCGQRTIVSGVTTTEVDALQGRTSWSIPRNSPAIANTMSLEFRAVSGTSPVLIDGIAAKFVDLTEQRSRR